MAWLFSKRCQQALRDDKIKVSIPLHVRVRIWKALEDHSEWSQAWDERRGPYDSSTIIKLPEWMEAELGLRELLAFPESGGAPAPSNLEGFILRGPYPPYLFDAIELFYQNLSENREPFQSCCNSIMEEHGLAWRMAGGKIFPVDSVYIAEEIAGRAYQLLQEVGFQGAQQEFEKARVDLINGDYEGAIQNANLAVESTIKEILEIKRAKPGELFHNLAVSGLIPEYYNGFLKAFEENILRCVAIIRNEELGVGHGKGPSKSVIPRELAELAVNLSGVLINYLTKQHLGRINASARDEEEIDVEDLPF
ncbi:MAG: hypothetical protein D4R82_01270 [Dehalococcoidia bacterium]|nr:MAG: hypothetical protein D4R82_01270 [Dehalococcoidia bacterium]